MFSIFETMQRFRSCILARQKRVKIVERDLFSVRETDSREGSSKKMSYRDWSLLQWRNLSSFEFFKPKIALIDDNF